MVPPAGDARFHGRLWRRGPDHRPEKSDDCNDGQRQGHAKTTSRLSSGESVRENVDREEHLYSVIALLRRFVEHPPPLAANRRTSPHLFDDLGAVLMQSGKQPGGPRSPAW